jgi:hypothetical protein
MQGASPPLVVVLIVHHDAALPGAVGDKTADWVDRSIEIWFLS